MNDQKVGVVVLNYEQWQATCRCLDAIWTMDSPPELVVVCDNASRDDSVRRIRKYVANREPGTGGEVVLIENPGNGGYAAGNNPGIRLSLESGCDFVWILNNDSYPEYAALGKLLECAGSMHRAGILGATLVEADAPDVIQSAGGCRYNPWTTMFTPNHAGRGVDELDDLPDITMDYVSGASMFCRRKVFEDVGLLSEDFFLFYEEIDLCRRARAAGYEPVWCRGAIVRHEGALSVGKPGQDRERTVRANYHENFSTLIYTRKHHTLRLPVSMGVRFFGKLAIIVTNSQWYLFSPLVQAFRDFLIGQRPH
jgi:hypothetical protein